MYLCYDYNDTSITTIMIIIIIIDIIDILFCGWSSGSSPRWCGRTAGRASRPRPSYEMMSKDKSTN